MITWLINLAFIKKSTILFFTNQSGWFYLINCWYEITLYCVWNKWNSKKFKIMFKKRTQRKCGGGPQQIINAIILCGSRAFVESLEKSLISQSKLMQSQNKFYMGFKWDKNVFWGKSDQPSWNNWATLTQFQSEAVGARCGFRLKLSYCLIPCTQQYATKVALIVI